MQLVLLYNLPPSWLVEYDGTLTQTSSLLRQRNTRFMFRFKIRVDVSHFSPCVTNLSCNKNSCCGLKTVVTKS